MTDYKTLSDAELITLLKESNHTAYTEIYKRYHYLMITFAYRKLGDRDLTKDFVQELFISLWHKRNTILETGNLSSYLYISLRSKILDYFDHQNVKSKYIDSLSQAMETSGNNQTDYLARENFMKAYIEKQIIALPRKMRTVFELSRKEYLSHKEIAETLNTSEDNVSKHITSALKTLRAKLTALLF